MFVVYILFIIVLLIIIVFFSCFLLLCSLEFSSLFLCFFFFIFLLYMFIFLSFPCSFMLMEGWDPIDSRDVSSCSLEDSLWAGGEKGGGWGGGEREGVGRPWYGNGLDGLDAGLYRILGGSSGVCTWCPDWCWVRWMDHWYPHSYPGPFYPSPLSYLSLLPRTLPALPLLPWCLHCTHLQKGVSPQQWKTQLFSTDICIGSPYV